VQIELIPTLDHCIESTAKKEYHRLTLEYLGGKGPADFEDKVDLLRTFLETSDFRQLRKESEAELLKEKTVKFILRMDKGEFTYQMVVD
jgi:hypothetical protein